MTPRVRRSDRGAFLLIFALALVFLLTLVAFAVDLGQGRLQRRNNQQVVDLATLAAGAYLAGYGGSGPSPVQASPYDACTAAINSVQANARDFRPQLTSSEIAAACSVFFDPYATPLVGAPCDPAAPTPIETIPIVRGPYELTIRHPIPAGELEDERFRDGIGANDGTSACARMRISIVRADETTFARVIGVDEVRTRASAVVKGTVDPGGEVIPAFLILERHKCGALGNSVGGDSEGIVVEAVDGQPGYIHVDSAANGAVPADCANNTNSADGVVAYASPLPSGEPSLTVESAGTAPGVLSIVATGARAATGGGFNVEPTGGETISRVPVDDVFNDAENPAVSAMHTDAQPDVAATENYGASSDLWLELDCDLLPKDSDALDIAASKWYVDCADVSFDDDMATRITDPADGDQITPTDLVFGGNVDVPTGKVFDAAGVDNVVVRGELTSPGSTRLPDAKKVYVGNGVDVAGDLRVGTSSLPTVDGDSIDTVCEVDSPTGRSIEMVVFYGDNTNPSRYALGVSGAAALCDTTVYLAGSKGAPEYTRWSDTTTAAYGCSDDLPCPASVTTVANARWNISGLVEWTAPNNVRDDDEMPSPRGREDLMFWSEAERTSTVSGTLVSSGVSVAPNMRVELQSPAVSNPRNSQFIARQLYLFQGTLRMRPLPDDNIPVPAPGSFTIIR